MNPDLVTLSEVYLGMRLDDEREKAYRAELRHRRAVERVRETEQALSRAGAGAGARLHP